MNKITLWAVRTTGIFGSFWFFFWGFIWEMVRWQKPQPDLVNTMLFFGSLLLVGFPNLKKPQITKRVFKPVKPTKPTPNLGTQLLEAKPTERAELMKKFLDN